MTDSSVVMETVFVGKMSTDMELTVKSVSVLTCMGSPITSPVQKQLVVNSVSHSHQAVYLI